MFNDPVIQRIYRRCIVEEMTGCWLFQTRPPKEGETQADYPSIKIGCETLYVHRAVAAIRFPNADITQLNICHTCDNKRCVHPYHLFIGTQLMNIHDAKNKGIIRLGRKPKLTDEVIATIAQQRNDGLLPKQIAFNMNISIASVYVALRKQLRI